MDNTLNLVYTRNDEIAPMKSVLFYIGFIIYLVFLIYVVFTIVRLYMDHIPSRILFYYYLNLSFMLGTRVLYFADAMIHYPYVVYFALDTIPVLFLFTAGTIAIYMWRKLYI
jgi:hypothetical protein